MAFLRTLDSGKEKIIRNKIIITAVS